MNRRGFLGLIGSAFGAAAIATELDLEKLLWIPGRKTLFIPPADLTIPDIVYCSLHRGAPSDAGSAEATYASYVRMPVSVVKRRTGWRTVGAPLVAPNTRIDFPECTGGAATVTHLGLWTSEGQFMIGGPILPTVHACAGASTRLILNVNHEYA